MLLAPFLQVIFKAGVNSVITSRFNFWPISKLYGWLNQQTLTPQGSIKALGVIVVIVVIAVLLKNLFAYLALYVLNPIRNSIINDMRKDMFNKIFRLPIGYFNEQRKGDLMSRLTNDLSVIEYSTISFLEVLFRERHSYRIHGEIKPGAVFIPAGVSSDHGFYNWQSGEITKKNVYESTGQARVHSFDHR